MINAKLNKLKKIFIEFYFFVFKVTRGKPRSFNEKIKYKAAFDRRDILTTFADKIAVREYVANIIGGKYLTKSYLMTDRPDEIQWSSLPNEFVMKMSHCSGASVIVWEGAEESILLPTNKKNVYWNRYQIAPNNLVKESLVSLANVWLSKNYAYSSPLRRIPEWGYLNIVPGIIFEELLLEDDFTIPKDYKFHMFNGRCEMINVIKRNKFGQVKPKRNFSTVFDANWKKLDVSLNGNFPPINLPEKPENLAEMLEVAHELAQSIDYVRVDLYNIRSRIVFGELTSYPQAGQNTYHFEPYSQPDKKKSLAFDNYLGSKLVLDKY